MAESEGEKAAGAERQADGLEPIGQALRATYDAENHDSLGRDLTGLMLALARVDDPLPPVASPPVTLPPIAPPSMTSTAVAPTSPRSWRERLFGR